MLGKQLVVCAVLCEIFLRFMGRDGDLEDRKRLLCSSCSRACAVLCRLRRAVKTVNKRERLVGGECALLHPAAGGRGIKHPARGKVMG